MTPEYNVGVRVKLSALGKERCPRLSNKTGTLVGPGIYANSVVIVVDGNRTSSTIHATYLESIQDHWFG